MEGAGVGGAWSATLGHDSGQEEGKRSREVRGADPRPQLGQRRSGVAWPRRAAGGGERGSGAAKLVGGPDLGEKGKGTSGALLPTLVWARVQRGGSSMAAGVLGWRQWWAEALGAQEEAWSGGGDRGGEGRREGPFYRRNKAAGRAVGRWPWCGRPASSMGAINGDWSRGSSIRGGTGVT